MAHSEPKRRRVEGSLEETTKLAFDDIREEHIEREGEKGHVCDKCISSMHELYEFAFYLCFTCVKYFCQDCFIGHNDHHRYVSLESDENERERTRKGLLESLRRDIMRKNKLENVNVSVCDLVDVYHELDKKEECWISGLCGVDNRMWVACDLRNYCIKIFQCGSNVLLRYLRIGSKPGDVTEIRVKQNSTVQDSASSSSSDISGTNRTKPDKQCLLAVTLPPKRHILFIDLNKNPAVRVKSLTVVKPCYGIEYTDDKIFTVCKEDPGLNDSRWSVYVLSTDGVQLSIIRTDIQSSFMPDIAVLPGRVYLTDRDKNGVKCLDVQGRVLSQIIMDSWEPRGISVDLDHNVYISSGFPYGYVYALDIDLGGPPRPLLDSSIDHLEHDKDKALCFHRDKLHISHWCALENTVYVVRLV